MYLNRLALPRRTVLRGIGATVALPFLDSMVPALRGAAGAVPKRLGVVYAFPNGVLLKDLVPSTVGKDFEIRPILRPLEKHREQLTIISGLANANADIFETGNGPHSRTSGCWLSGTRPKRTEGPDLRTGRTADQYAADVLGKETPLRSLELALEPNFVVGNCEGGYACTYLNTFTWGAPDRPLPMETNPAVVFERLFGESDPGPARLAQLRRDRSILDSVTGDLARLQRRVGPADRQTVDEYLDSVRDVERRIQQTGSRDVATDGFEKPYGVPALFEDHAKLMFDLMYLAFRTDMTRVVSFQIAREISTQPYPQLGVADAHHDVSHHRGNAGKIANKAKIDEYHISLVAHLVDRMASTPEGDGTLLSNSILLLGGGFGDGDLHLPHNLPVVLAGSGGGALRTGRHVRAQFDTPFMNLCLSLLDKFGAHVETIGDSTGRLADI